MGLNKRVDGFSWVDVRRAFGLAQVWLVLGCKFL